MAKRIVLLLNLILFCIMQQLAAQTAAKSKDTSSYQPKYPRQEVAVINSGYAEVRPLISNDGTTLYFSRRYHPDNAKGEKDFQDVWVSYKDSLAGQWSEPQNLGPVINNKKRNAIACISPDGLDAVFFNTYRKTRRMPLARSRKNGNKWTKPKVMNIDNYVNVSDYADFFVDFKHKVLFLAVEADSSFGDQDLYISFLDPYGGWKEPINLGGLINSDKADFAPFVGADGRSLFFCSYGHDGLGGSDIYMSVRLDDTWLNWSEPINLGAAINSPEEETYFSITGDFKYMYYNTYPAKAKDRNIIRVELPEDFMNTSGPLLARLDSTTLSTVLLNGMYESKSVGGRRSFEEETMVDNNTGAKAGNLLADERNNSLEKVVEEEILKVLKSESPILTRTVEPTTSGVSPAHTASGLSVAALEMQTYLQQALPDLGLEVRQKQDTVEFKIVQNLLYDFNSVFVNPDYLSRLSKMARILREKPELKVQLIGHTDNIGEEEVNKRVAKQRVENLVYYFKDRKVKPDRIEIVGAGPSNPMASNESEEGRVQNRRVETIILFIE